VIASYIGKLYFSFIDDGKLGFVEGMMENCRKTERERMTNGESFFTNDPQLMEDKKNARILCSRFNSSPEDESLRKALLKQLFGHCGERIAIKPPFHCDYGYNIFAGDDLFINFDCVFLDAAPIRIGEHCMIGPKTCIYAIGHPLDAESRREKIGIPKPVTIGDNVWIGGGVTILPGVSIGDSTVIAAASVVTKSFPDHVVIAGNPAKIIKNIEE
jgi:maltose O-acetyltransferase